MKETARNLVELAIQFNENFDLTHANVPGLVEIDINSMGVTLDGGKFDLSNDATKRCMTKEEIVEAVDWFLLLGFAPIDIPGSSD
jgi:hypothetical protein